MRLLRTVSTRRLLAGLAGLIIVAVVSSAIAVAAAGTGPVPKKRSLASAIHAALSAKSVKGLSADISFTDNLVSSNDIQGSDPLLTGASGRLWVGDGRIRLELQSDNGDAQVVAGRGSFWIYDPAMNVVYRGQLPASSRDAARASASRHQGNSVPTVAQIQKTLQRVAAHLSLSGARPTDVAGRPAYRVAVSPKSSGGLIGALKLAWDATRGVPLDFAIYAKGNSTPVMELKATGVSYGRVPVSDFQISPPSGTKVVNLTLPKAPGSSGSSASQRAKTKAVTRVAAVRKQVSFTLAAPASLAGRDRHSVSLIGGHGHHGVLLSYGQGLGAVIVIERPASPGGSVLPNSSSNSSSEDGPGLTLPTASIDGVTAQQLPTPLGTVVQFTRQGVSYVVIGSVTAQTADRAARGL